MHPSAVKRFSRLLGWALVLGSAASAESAPGPSHVVRLDRAAARAASRLALAPRFAADYGGFRYLELSAADVARLEGAGVPFTEDRDAGQVQIGRFRFDPRRDGEPAIGAGEAASGTSAGFRLVQLRGPAKDEWLAELRRAGLPLLQYYPFDTYLTWAAPGVAEDAAARPFVRWQGLVHPAYKVSPELDGRTGTIRNVDVTVYDDGKLDAVAAEIEKLGGKVLQRVPAQPDRTFYSIVAELPASALAAMARLPSVLFLGFQGPRPVFDDEMSDQIQAGNHPGGVPVTGYNAHLATLGVDGSGVTWAIVDTGIDYDHPDLASRIVGGYEFPGSCNIAGQPGSDCAAGGHGTHVAGIVGGTAAAGFADPSGFLYGLGVAPSVGLFAMNSLSAAAWPPAGGWQEHSKRAVLGSAVGGNNSWTTSEGSNHGYQASERAHDLMVRDGNFDTTTVAEPFIEVFSAGNSGPGASTLTAPKEAKNLIVVASSANYRVGSIDSIASSSSRGPAADGRIVPTLTAPGEEIASTRNDTGGDCSTAIAGTSNRYAFCSGTSMAAPHASGAAVLAVDRWRDLHAGATPSPALVKALLVASAVDMGAADIPNFNEGWGRVDITRLLAPGVPRVDQEQDPARTFASAGEVYERTVGVPDLAKPFKVTVAWTDAAGAVGANPALVNDLDLEVVFGSTTYLGNQFAAGWSTPGGTPDARNNLENVFVQTPPSSSATIRVRATAINGDGVPYNADATDQDFALVCTNCAEQADFTLRAVPASQAVCAPTEAAFAVEVGSLLGFVNPVTLSLIGEPIGASDGFSVNPVTPADPAAASTLTLANTEAAVPGTYAMMLVGAADGADPKSFPLSLSIDSVVPPAPSLTAPADGALGVAVRPTLQWEGAAQAASYRLEVSTSVDFTPLLVDESGLTGTSFTPTSDLPSSARLFWRVTATNACGPGVASAVHTFATVTLPGDCSLGSAAAPVYAESFDGAVTGWTHGGTGDTWALSTLRSHSGTTSYLGVDATSVSDQRLVSPPIVLPAAGADLTLQFWNYQSFEDRTGGCYDGAIVEVSTDGGASWTQLVAPALLTDPYDGPVSASYSNPLANLEAWCGDPQGWLSSVIDLSAHAGDTVQFRFRVGTDTSAGRAPDGWNIDDVKVQVCFVRLAVDGFESGDLSAWSAREP